MNSLEPEALRELLVKCWMSHDGMWFYNCMLEYGAEAANRLNKAAIRSLAPIELGRVTKALGIKRESIESFDDARAIIDGMFSVVKGDFMDFDYCYPVKNLLRWEMRRCFALEGMRMIGAEEQYECGVLYRVTCWLDSAGIEYTVEPVGRCLQLDRGECSGDVRFNFPA